MHPHIPNAKFAEPIKIADRADAFWYHHFDWPDGTTTRGRLDFRDKADLYLGRLDYSGKSVLEIGPASGFLTKELAQRGAFVTCIELPDDHPWDVVPRTDIDTEEWINARRAVMPRLRASWWYAVQEFNVDARMLYWSVDNLPLWFGKVRFDVVFLGSVLQHFRDPIRVLYDVARLTGTIVISELQVDRLEVPGAGAQFVPDRSNQALGSWWNLPSHIVRQVLGTVKMERVSHEVEVYRIWASGAVNSTSSAMKGETDDTDPFTDRNIWTSVFKGHP